MLRRYVNDSAAHDRHRQLPLPGWLEHAARRLDDVEPTTSRSCRKTRSIAAVRDQVAAGASSTPADPAAFVGECERLGQPYRVLRSGERLTGPA
jgi:hypothetical protein